MADKRPLQKQDAENIANELRTLLGEAYTVSFSGTGMVMVYAVVARTTARPVLVLNWLSDLGEWVPSVTQPQAFCWDDLSGLAEEVERCQEASQRILNAWKDYKLKKNGSQEEEAWEAYQGVLAGHYFRMYEPESAPSSLDELAQEIQKKKHTVNKKLSLQVGVPVSSVRTFEDEKPYEEESRLDIFNRED